MSVNKGA